MQKNLMQGRPKTEVTDDDDSDAGVSLTKCRQVQVLTQTLFHTVHRGRKRTPMHLMNSQTIYDTYKSKTVIKSGRIEESIALVSVVVMMK